MRSGRASGVERRRRAVEDVRDRLTEGRDDPDEGDGDDTEQQGILGERGTFFFADETADDGRHGAGLRAVGRDLRRSEGPEAFAPDSPLFCSTRNGCATQLNGCPLLN